MEIVPFPALRDNYIWLLKNSASRHVAIVDPGEAGPLLKLIDNENLIPIAILITHHHWDHVNGIINITRNYNIPVYTPKQESVPGSTHPVGEGDKVSLPELETEFEILNVPGHTLGAVAYYTDRILFTGDTLFTAGCGRLFEGTASQLYQSLLRLAAFPDDSLIYCGHEYTMNNLKFAARVEPENGMIQERLNAARATRAREQATVPATLAIEKQTNPFLRCEKTPVISAAERYVGKTLDNPTAVFNVLRQWKNHF